VGLEPTKIGFAGQRLDRFGITTSENPYPNPTQTYTRVIPKTVPKLPTYGLFTPFLPFLTY
jgi:hypothetical protein